MMGIQQNSQEIEKWGRFELTMQGPSEGNPFQEVQLSARFQYKNYIVQPDGFYDGNGTYRIRFMPDRVGVWTYVTQSNHNDLDGQHGEFMCVEASRENHGPVRVKDQYVFAFEDGTPYMPFGTTCYHWTHHGNELLEELTLESLKESPFNKVRMCLLPTRDMKAPLRLVFDGSCPEDVDKTRFNPDFFNHFEKRITDLMDLGIEADLVLFHPYDKGFWGVDNMDAASDTFYLRYVIARLSSFRNVWWSLCNEYDFNTFKTVEDWDRLIQFVQHHDPYQHLRSIHNGTKMYKSSWVYDFSKPWITHQSIQHWDAELTTSWREANAKPVVIDEISYEGNSSRRWGNISGEEMTHRFWEAMSRGGFVGHGESFIDKETRAWISSGGKLYGESTQRIAFLRKLMEEGPSDWIKAWQRGEYGLQYFGHHQHAYTYVELSDNASYRLEIIDTWDMTVTPVKGTFCGRTKVDLPGKPNLALRIWKL
ncbi:alpha-L-rhamnosidase [Paenibacillus sp. Soil766]|uniref:DUF5060 domain-containing protein n=1 Tax=Paenibacillus sp. Soil766 TaxID=1736404 RepID=UPI00070F1766|nr:DUF5060 domain-containing protein [Paenibacillus sp. Soil766]KRF06837.1 alpha-L-rhamnosidase [Paenibacillus sp. Soil766]